MMIKMESIYKSQDERLGLKDQGVKLKVKGKGVEKLV
jgi:hypothetical protein